MRRVQDAMLRASFAKLIGYKSGKTGLIWTGFKTCWMMNGRREQDYGPNAFRGSIVNVV